MTKTYQHSTVQASDHTLNHILDIIEEGTWDWNANTGHVDRSPGWYRMLGYDVDIFDKNVFTWENIIHPDDYKQVMQHFEQYIKGEIAQYSIEYRCKKADGSYLWIFDQGKICATNADGSVARMIGAHLNIDKQKAAQNELLEQNRLLKDGNINLENLLRHKAEELEKKNQELEKKIEEIAYLSNTDPLTGIANRKKFEEVLENEIARCNRYHHPMSLAIFDIDYFKQVNDGYGHKTGDLVLQKLSRLVQENIREIDSIARWGGEEFTLIFPELPLHAAVKVAEKLQKLISQHAMTDELKITCSFGVTQYHSDNSIEQLFQRADEALYLAKDSGRNRVECLV